MTTKEIDDAVAYVRENTGADWDEGEDGPEPFPDLQFIAHAKLLAAEVARLRTDGERLDWLNELAAKMLGSGPAHRAMCQVHRGTPIREAIDAAMAPRQGAAAS